MIIPQERNMLTIAEVSEMLHIHPNTLRRWCEEGRIPAYRINSRGDRRFKMADVQEFIEKFSAYKEGEE